jgi:hypothetical protein
MNSKNIESSYNRDIKEEKKLNTTQERFEQENSLKTAIGTKAILIEDFPSPSEGAHDNGGVTQEKELAFTSEDQDIHHEAAKKFIAGHTALQAKTKENLVSPTEALAEGERLKEQYMHDIKGMSKL